ncbi:MAG: hypothetical protein ACXWWC_03930 [Chitinophagaceae bacterium]
MKTTFARLFAASFLLVMLACNNEKKKEETTTTTKEQPATTPATTTPAEPKKTEISIGPDGAEVKTKSGTEVKVSDKGTTVGSKDVKIDIKKKDEKQ